MEVEATADSGLAETSYIQCELIRSVNARRLVHRLGVIGTGASRQVTEIVKALLVH